jgi:Protein of unknown function (DUF2490)
VRSCEKARFSTRDIPGDGMRMLKRLARHLLPGLFVIGVIARAAPCVAQEVDAPTAPNRPEGRGSVVAPSPWLVVGVPLRPGVDLKLNTFYIGELNVPVVQIDVPIRATKFLTITPSYLYNWIPASGLNKITPQPLGATDSYDENQFRIDGTVTVPIHKFEISARNMYVRRFLPGAADDINRYRGRVGIARAVAIGGRTVKPFAYYESFYERKGGWNKDRIWSGVTLPVTKHLMFQPSYMWERSQGARDVNYLLFGVIVNTTRNVVRR